MLIAAADALKTHRIPSWAAAGLLLGLSAIARPTILLALPLILLAQIRAKSGPAIAGLVFAACALLAPLIVTGRNAVVGHDLVFIASQGGVNLFVGNHDGVDGFTPTTPCHYGYTGAYQDAIELYGQRAAEEALHRPLKASQVSAYWGSRTVRWWRDHPVATAGLALKKIVLMWTKAEIRDNVAFDYVRKEWTPILWLAGLGFWLAGPLGIAGIAGRALSKPGPERNHRGGSRDAIVWLLCAYVLVTMTSFVVFFAAERFRLPVVPALLLLAGSACVDIADAVRNRSRRVAGAICAAGLLGCLLVNITWYRTESNQVKALDYWSCGNRYVALRHYSEAVKQYVRASMLDPTNADIWLNLGGAYYYGGNALAALRVWKTANALSPSASGYYDLGTCEDVLGLRQAAKRDLDIAGQLLKDQRAVPSEIH
jgi:tetratricopeptide (TPR) repeat protein